MASIDFLTPFSLQDLGLAYRKAKVDLYYSSTSAITAIANYEEQLHARLTSLLERLNSTDETWVKTPAFLGTWTIAPKEVRQPKDANDAKGTEFIFSSPNEEWLYRSERLNGKDEKPEAIFRVMADCSLDFHVLSALWIQKVGHLFDSLLTECAYGNRLRRTLDRTGVNPLSLGSFVPYLKPFRDWRDRGIDTMQTALKRGKAVVALTADVSSFYHELNPRFMLDPRFVSGVLSLSLSPEQQRLHTLFISALEAWAENSPLQRGLPVGLPASAVVANMALIELDRVIEQQVAPLYYGRYVDDILLVMENGAGFRSIRELWEWLFARSEKKLAWVKGKENEQIKFQPVYFRTGKGKSEIHFSNAKNKVFLLTGQTGRTLIDAIAHQIRKRVSEWRAMPQLPLSADEIGTDLLAAIQSDGEAADNLRKANGLTMRRAHFAITLRDYEAYERDLPPSAWQAQRRAFFVAFIDHVIVLPHFFELAGYLPRVIRLATACADFAELRNIIGALLALCKQVEENCRISIKALPKRTRSNGFSALEVLRRWRKQLFQTVVESITAAFPRSLSSQAKRSWAEHMSDCPEELQEFVGMYWSADNLQNEHSRYFAFDLAHMPFRFIGLPAEMVAQRGIGNREAVTSCDQAETFLPSTVTEGVAKLAEWIRLSGYPHGFVFPTRPFNMMEMFVLTKNPFGRRRRKEMESVVLAMRGFSLNEKMPKWRKKRILQIPDGESPDRYRIAVSSWKTRIDSWVASVRKEADPDAERYSRLSRMIDVVISYPQGCRYLILPELSLPAHWFIRVARKLQGRGISLIAGVEYLHAEDDRVRNQVWTALSHDGLGFPSAMIYRQDKQRPALHEEREIQRLAGLTMRPEKEWTVPPIVEHGKFRFAFLICSELTNISYRSSLRGEVDALFVPEWNQDTDTFNSLVECAALDIHAFIIQCNNREFGDSRIRAPAKDSWERDILRVKGGLSDYCVIGEIDVSALRKFQTSHRSPGKPFKPVPDGFEIEPGRKALPLAEGS